MSPEINATQCPEPLPSVAYATKCTGKTVVAKNKTYVDCPAGQKPEHVMDPRISGLIEKLRCSIGDKVFITSGYRSPEHNLYSWAYVVKETGDEKIVQIKSKHQLGKAVDFYVEGADTSELRLSEKKLHEWAGSLSQPLRGSTDSIWTKVYSEKEGRDPDNQHSYPYMHIEVRE